MEGWRNHQDHHNQQREVTLPKDVFERKFGENLESGKFGFGVHKRRGRYEQRRRMGDDLALPKHTMRLAYIQSAPPS